MKLKYKLIKDETKFKPTGLSAVALSFSHCLERRLLISPDTSEPLVLEGKESLTDGTKQYSVNDGCPVLYPNEITEAWIDGKLALDYYSSSLKQYVLLSQIKQSGDINAPSDSVPALKHYHRFKEFCKGLSGLVLDVGSDRPSFSVKLFSPQCEYLGIDPYAGHGEFRIIGLGEILPIRDQSVDVVVFNTSLDHILDYHTAIEEAFRVLKPNGNIIIETNAWLERATLLTDDVHFHHFREFEILASLERYFNILDIVRYEDVKHRSHLYSLFVRGLCKAN